MGSVEIQQLKQKIQTREKRLHDAENRIARLCDELTRRWLPQGSESRERIDEELDTLRSAVAHFGSELPFLRQYLRELQEAEDRILRNWQYSRVELPNQQRPPDTYKDDWVDAERRRRPWTG